MQQLPTPARTGREPQVGYGIFLGVSAALSWAVYNVGTKIGQVQGFRPSDMTLIRFLVAALILAPFLFSSRPGPRPFQTVILVLLVGPTYAFLFNSGFSYAPLTHAVVIIPAVSMIVANCLGRILSGDPLPPARIYGMLILIAGLVLMATTGTELDPSKGTILGDLAFLSAGILWGTFTFCMGRWRLDPVKTTASISILATLVFFPVYLKVWGLPEHSVAEWTGQIIYQGLIGGTLAFILFGATVARLGGGSAAMFPAIVPPLTIALGVPMLREWPTSVQLASVVLATIGLVVSLDLGALLKRKR